MRQHHLAHLAPAPACESWLHSTAKLILSERISDAVNEGDAVPIRWSCPDDGRQHSKDLLNKKTIDAVEVEYFWADKNIRPDVVCLSSGRPIVLIEVVVTHKPEQAVLESGIATLEVHVSDPGELDKLRKGVVDLAAIHNYSCPDPTCAVCGGFSSKCSADAQLAESLLKGMGKRRRGSNRLQPITQDKFGNYLHGKTRWLIQSRARKLASLGFQQQASRPTLFKYGVPGWNLYADLGGTDVLKIWEAECVPAVYAFATNKNIPTDEIMRKHLMSRLESILDENRIPWRRHFYDKSGSLMLTSIFERMGFLGDGISTT